jgi:hypothetical protein
VFQSWLIADPSLGGRYLGTGMLHCNTKLMWQSSYALSGSKAYGRCIIDFESVRSRGQRSQSADEIARSRQREMRC